jgi:hypothetical protein
MEILRPPLQSGICNHWRSTGQAVRALTAQRATLEFQRSQDLVELRGVTVHTAQAHTVIRCNGGVIAIRALP